MPKMNNNGSHSVRLRWRCLLAGYVVTEANSANASTATTQPTATRPAKVTRSADSTRSFYRERGKRF
jgi:hypothetical protein